MPCPFPGTDPYLELSPFGGDFTPRFITTLANTLLARLLPRYDVRVEEYLYVAHEEIRLHRVRPDLTIAAAPPHAPPSGKGAILLEPATEELEYPELEPRTQRHVKIIHSRSGRVVTVIEVLSPTNKQPGEDGLDAYLEKRAELIVSLINLVRGARSLDGHGGAPCPRSRSPSFPKTARSR